MKLRLKQWKPSLKSAKLTEFTGSMTQRLTKTLQAPARTLVLLPPHRPVLAAMLSILPGVGQLYIGQTKKGTTMLLLSLVLSLVVYPAAIIIPIGIIDAYILTQRLKRGDSIAPWECFWNRKPSTASIWNISEIIKKGRSQEPIAGVEERLIDNSRSGSTVTKTLTIIREWSCTYTIEHQHDHRTIDTRTVQVKDGITKARSVEDALRDRFAYTHGTKHVHEENVEVVIQPFKKMRVLLNWKNILEIGTIVLQDQYQARIELPFAIVIGVTFDQTQIDE